MLGALLVLVTQHLRYILAATPPMGTASGFFGITYQGAVNGLASQTLSIFNMVRRA